MKRESLLMLIESAEQIYYEFEKGKPAAKEEHLPVLILPSKEEDASPAETILDSYLGPEIIVGGLDNEEDETFDEVILDLDLGEFLRSDEFKNIKFKDCGSRIFTYPDKKTSDIPAERLKNIIHRGKPYGITLQDWDACYALNKYSPLVGVDYHHVVALKFRPSSIKAIPREVNLLSCLSELDLSGNKIRKLSNIDLLTRLETLKASNTKLEDVLELFNNLYLRNLDLNNNPYLKEVGILVKHSYLEKVNLQHTRIKTIVPFLRNEKLRELRVSDTQIDWNDHSNIAALQKLEARGVKVYR